MFIFVSFSSRRGQFDTSLWRWEHEGPLHKQHRSRVTIGQIEAGGDRECAETLCSAGRPEVADREVIHRRSHSLMSIRILFLMPNTWKLIPIRGLTMHEFTEFVR
ncbi:hypothetical protein [Mesorhizobium qingshengii]|uniref:hypothetical protein n=1 Tax=Mesorhizobium qingshengii TaxID=1165689 RepID=UPI000B826C46|nr:hypothetical protein [Mesorhizobium qingshengii]